MFRKKMPKELIDYQNELISNHCDEVENIYRQMRSWRHDFHNHIQMIKACIAVGQIDEVSAYCDKLDEELKTVDQVIKTGNVMLDAILNSKISLARHHEIEVHAKASVPKRLAISDVDLCVLMGNLLDNAREACIPEEGGETLDTAPFIRIYIGMKGHQLYICVTNTVFRRMGKGISGFLSTKGEGLHGFGLQRIDKICKKYGGYCKRGSEPGAFTTEILLPEAG